MKSSCDEETDYTLTYSFVTQLWFTLLELTNQRVCHFKLSWVYIWTRTTYAEARRGRMYGTFVHCSAFAEASNRPYINVLNANSLRSTDNRWIMFGCSPNIRCTTECCLPLIHNMSILNDHFIFACHIRILFAFILNLVLQEGNQCSPLSSHNINL